MLAGEGVVETVHQHRIEDLSVAHAVAPAAGAHEIGGTVHVLHAAGHRAVDETEHDLLSRARDRLRTRPANAVDRQRRNTDRDAAMDGRLSGRVHFVAGLDHVAHDDRTDIAGRQFRALKRGADGHGAEIDRRRILQRAAVCADGGAHGRTDYDFLIGHGSSPRFQCELHDLHHTNPGGSHSAIMLPNHLCDTGGTLAALDLDGDLVGDAQRIRRHVLRRHHF